jgi:hypothetical protein
MQVKNQSHIWVYESGTQLKAQTMLNCGIAQFVKQWRVNPILHSVSCLSVWGYFFFSSKSSVLSSKAFGCNTYRTSTLESLSNWPSCLSVCPMPWMSGSFGASGGSWLESGTPRFGRHLWLQCHLADNLPLELLFWIDGLWTWGFNSREHILITVLDVVALVTHMSMLRLKSLLRQIHLVACKS